MSRQNDIEKLIYNHTRRLQKLKEQQALAGMLVDPKVLIEVEEIEIIIEILKKELQELAKDTSPIIGAQIAPVESAIIPSLPPLLPADPQVSRSKIQPSTILHNLPQPDYGQFIGREKELSQILDILRPYPHSQYPIVTIDGIGGIGKSALALEISYKFLNYDGIRPQENFDAIIWTSAKQNTLTAEGIQPRQQALRTLDDIYTTISIVLRSENITRARPEEQSELVRRALSQQRTLLIVDNLETVDDKSVMNFLRELPAPTKAVVTTRHRIDVAYPVRLLDMPWSDAKALIEQECKKKGVSLNNAELQTLYGRTRGVPIAIVWSIGQMGLGYSISNILARLEKPESEIAHFCFDVSVKLIRNRPAHKVLMSLSLFASGASRDDLGYTAELQELDRDDALVTVEKLSLVNKQGDMFSMLPLAKIYSLQELEKNLDFAYSATDRRIRYLLGLMNQTERQYWIQDQQTIMEEGENFLSLFEWSLAHKRNETALSIIKFAVLYLQYAGRRAEALSLARYGIQLANEYNNKSINSWLLVDAGWILNQLGSHTEAIENIKEALTNYQLIEDEIGVCFANCFLAQALRHAGNTTTGEQLLVSTSEHASQLEYTEGIAIAEFEFGKLAREKKDWQAAYHHLAKAYSALQMMESSPDIFSLAIQGNYGTAALRLEKYNEARDITEGVLRYLEIWRKFGLASNFTARMYLQQAEIEIGLNRPYKAIEYSQKALDLSKSTKDEKGIAQANRMLEKVRS